MALFLFGLVSTIALFQTLLSILFIVGLIFRLKKKENNVCIVVLGDIGRSPRMQYHAVSYLKENYQVRILGFHGSTPIHSLSTNKNASFVYLNQPLKRPKWMPGIVYYVCKTIYQTVQLFLTLLFFVEKPGHFLVQNPPAIPTLSVVWLISCIKGCNFVIDWHNYAYTILNMNMKDEKHIFVRFAKWYEGFFGYFADKNICVTKAMKDDLKVKWNIDADVLYDRPPEHFKETSIREKHNLFSKLAAEGYKEFSNEKQQSTIFTNNDGTHMLQDRPAILISSTSWTEDEDFGILLDALEVYEKAKTNRSDLPKLNCIITGKGPLKCFYKKIIKEKRFENIVITTPWLSADDYPKIIGSGDLGICLHTSSSGLDLPMKVVDMFGCGIPVCAVSFSCLNELVKHNINGLVFQSSKDLAEQIIELFTNFPKLTKKLQTLRSNVAEFQKIRWHENWRKTVLPMLSTN